MAQQGPSSVPHSMASSAPQTPANHPSLVSASDFGRSDYDPYLDDIIIDPIQARLYNWLNGPTTLHHLEINALVNNITFVIRSIQINSQWRTGVDYSKLHESELHIVTAAQNDGFKMSIFFGNNLICVGEYVPHRELAMAGLRKTIEKMISDIIKTKAETMRNQQRGNAGATLHDDRAQGTNGVNGVNGAPSPGSAASPGQVHGPNGTSTDEAPYSASSGFSLLHSQVNGQPAANGQPHPGASLPNGVSPHEH